MNLLKSHGSIPRIENEYELTNEREDIFKIIIAYLYECDIDFTALTFEQKLLISESAHLYLIHDLFEMITKAMDLEFELGLNYDNILKSINFAKIFGFNTFEKYCDNFIRTNLKELMEIKNFVQELNKAQLIYYFDDLGNDLYMNELEVLQAIENWIQYHPELSEGIFIIHNKKK
jgi:hypothetical protein